ncbi:MAG: hypothetical protein AB3N63_02840 [Puniceicoccaceae bacterium]
MSLINEALKKAQGDRPSVNPNMPPPPDPGIPPQQPQPSPNRRRYLWGFVLSILVVGLLTTTLSTFLIYQILGEEENKGDKSDQSRLETVSDNVGELVEVVKTATSEEPAAEPVAEAAVQPEPVAPVEPAAVEPAPAQPEVAQTQVPVEPANATPSPTPVPEAVAQPQQQQPAAQPAVAETAPTPVSQPAPQPVVAQPESQPAQQPVANPIATPAEPAVVPVAVAAAPPPVENPAIWGRLENIEIRGIMSGGTKVMIFDADKNRTKTFRPGDLFDGSMSLKVATISPSAIIFEDNGGFRYTKSF